MVNGKQSEEEAEAEAEATNQSQVEAVKSLCVCSHLVWGREFEFDINKLSITYEHCDS